MAATLILGGARSGKSRFAQQLAEDMQQEDIVYLATCLVLDSEMEERVARHRVDRGEIWRTEESPFDLPERLTALDDPKRVCLVDCLSMWLSNMLCQDMPAAQLEQRFASLVDCLNRSRSTLFLVGNEVGGGLVPESTLSRRFRDLNGELNQRVAAACSSVYLVVAGIPVTVKRPGEPGPRPSSPG